MLTATAAAAVTVSCSVAVQNWLVGELQSSVCGVTTLKTAFLVDVLTHQCFGYRGNRSQGKWTSLLFSGDSLHGNSKPIGQTRVYSEMLTVQVPLRAATRKQNCRWSTI